MTKPGRNEPCPCGSGKKYKKCCINQIQIPANQAARPVNPKDSLKLAMGKIRELAARKEEQVATMGVFVLFSSRKGDAWLLEVSEMDAVQLAKSGQPLPVDLGDNPETIMVNWSHQFAITDGVFVTTAYEDKAEKSHKGYPAYNIEMAVNAVREKLSPEILKELHLPAEA